MFSFFHHFSLELLKFLFFHPIFYPICYLGKCAHDLLVIRRFPQLFFKLLFFFLRKI